MSQSMGSIIRRLRMEKGWTQEELGERLHLSGQSVSKWETEQSLPDISQVPQLAKTFGVTTDELFGLEEEPFGPAFSVTETDPEKAWSIWQELSGKMGTLDGSDANVWHYMTMGWELCRPESCLYRPERAEQVRKTLIPFAEAHEKQMKKAAVYLRDDFRVKLMQLYALDGQEEMAMAIAMEAPATLDHVNGRQAAVYRCLGKRQEEARSLTAVLQQSIHLVLSTTVARTECALALERREEAEDHAYFGLALIGFGKRYLDALPLFWQSDNTDLLQLRARAQLGQGKREEALESLRLMLKSEMDDLLVTSGGDMRSCNPQFIRTRQAALLRSLDHQDFAPLREDPKFRALRARAEALGEEA